jgi:hypothetical protein
MPNSVLRLQPLLHAIIEKWPPPKKPKELLPLPPRQRLQQRPDQSLDLGLTVFFASRLAHLEEPERTG